MMMLSAAPNVVRPMTIEDAVRVLHDLGDEGAPLAGGTWVMRTQHRGATFVGTYVSVHGLASLRGIDLGVLPRIGALVTHAELAEATLPPALIGLGIAAATSAFPAVRSVATLGGNLGASPFPEADLVPA